MKMKKRYWRDALWFGLGTFLGGFVVNFAMNLFSKLTGG